VISGADYLIWQTRTNRFRAFGWYSVVPVLASAAAPSH
jgi:hypothetical protein